MARFCGPIGYGVSVESPPGSGVYKDTITEKKYFGDLIRTVRRLQDTGEKLNRDISVENSISVVADAYLNQNFIAIRYVKWNGVYWTVDNADVQAPRLILRLGEVYNGPTAN